MQTRHAAPAATGFWNQIAFGAAALLLTFAGAAAGQPITPPSTQPSGSALSPRLPLRMEISLNGQWPEGGTVPVYLAEKERYDEKTFRRDVTIPADWNDKILRVEFLAVNHVATIYINDRKVAEHIGGWTPFTVEVPSEFSKPGTTFSLKVVVRGCMAPPMLDTKGNPLWPIGHGKLDNSFTGIIDDVFLRAYGKVAILDAFIQPSFRKKSLTVEYTVKNFDKAPHAVKIQAFAFPGRLLFSTPSFFVESPTVSLATGETRAIVVSSDWPNPDLWMPDEPYLYYLTSVAQEGDKAIDSETRRFGFREIWIDGNQFYINGVRVNLRGDNLRMNYDFPPTRFLTPTGWPQTVDHLKSMGCNEIRMHNQPTAQYMLDVADEKGFMIVEESALYGRDYYSESDITQLIANTADKWIPAWIAGKRNHPSIVIWSAENEKFMWTSADAPIAKLGEAIHKADPTRPYIYEGDNDLGGRAPVSNKHYPEDFDRGFFGNIYSWGPEPDKPTGIGEFLGVWREAADTAPWYQGTLIRGLRFRGFTDIRPFAMHWAWTGIDPAARRAATMPGAATRPALPAATAFNKDGSLYFGPAPGFERQYQNLINSWALVAVFDRDYDEEALAPVRDGKYPRLTEGQTVERHLILYNDEYRDTAVEVEVQMKMAGGAQSGGAISGGLLSGGGKRTYDVELGTHQIIDYSFQVPQTGGANIEMVLTTRKGGQVKFTEIRPFRVRVPGAATMPGAATRPVTVNPQPVSTVVTLGEGRKVAG